MFRLFNKNPNAFQQQSRKDKGLELLETLEDYLDIYHHEFNTSENENSHAEENLIDKIYKSIKDPNRLLDLSNLDLFEYDKLTFELIRDIIESSQIDEIDFSNNNLLLLKNDDRFDVLCQIITLPFLSYINLSENDLFITNGRTFEKFCNSLKTCSAESIAIDMDFEESRKTGRAIIASILQNYSLQDITGMSPEIENVLRPHLNDNETLYEILNSASNLLRQYDHADYPFDKNNLESINKAVIDLETILDDFKHARKYLLKKEHETCTPYYIKLDEMELKVNKCIDFIYFSAFQNYLLNQINSGMDSLKAFTSSLKCLLKDNHFIQFYYDSSIQSEFDFLLLNSTSIPNYGPIDDIASAHRLTLLKYVLIKSYASELISTSALENNATIVDANKTMEMINEIWDEFKTQPSLSSDVKPLIDALTLLDGSKIKRARSDNETPDHDHDFSKKFKK